MCDTTRPPRDLLEGSLVAEAALRCGSVRPPEGAPSLTYELHLRRGAFLRSARYPRPAAPHLHTWAPPGTGVAPPPRAACSETVELIHLTGNVTRASFCPLLIISPHIASTGNEVASEGSTLTFHTALPHLENKITEQPGLKSTTATIQLQPPFQYARSLPQESSHRFGPAAPSQRLELNVRWAPKEHQPWSAASQPHSSAAGDNLQCSSTTSPAAQHPTSTITARPTTQRPGSEQSQQ